MPKTADQLLQILRGLGRGVQIAFPRPNVFLVVYQGHPILVSAPPGQFFIVAYRDLEDLGPTPSAALLRTLLELGANHRFVKVCLPPRVPDLPREFVGRVGVMGELWNGPPDAPIAMPDSMRTVHLLIQEVASLSGAAAAVIQRAAGQAGPASGGPPGA